jgi:hypothetical protein
MVVKNVIPEICHVILEMRFCAFMYFRNYMADDHVIMETCFTEILQVCNFGMTWLSTLSFLKYTILFHKCIFVHSCISGITWLMAM